MFGFGHWEILAIIAVILLLFGPSKLPALGRSIGEGVRNLKKGLKKSGDEDEGKKKIESGDEDDSD
ncbi:MAG: twin-arginine translocase TatA/TatE family subunit [Deltaproteobacteria bacterium]|nr:twin-arginine translocase TatA/TatE family subunit [Deltaproteobacteria bacterium]